MKDLGRLLIVLVFIVSIVFMSFAVVLYATHENWKKKADALTVELQSKEKQLKDLEKAKSALETALKLENEVLTAHRNALNTKTESLLKENTELVAENAELQKNLQNEVAATAAAHETLGRLRDRLDGASAALFKAQQQWSAMASELVQTIDQVHSYALQVTTYQSVSAQLAKDYRNVVEVLKKHNLKPEPSIYSGQPPAGICGIITVVRPKGMVEISVGSDSGIAKGHQLDVVRNREGRSAYVGKVEVIETAPDKAVAKVLADYRRGTVQVADEVQYIDVNEIAAP
ncbi:MAG: hypothetical protein LBH00_08935 [Planctomycetaceae bacterium]|jgi:phage-related tail protein|nr:hypothetical protein [Planctomycetaceae bacterium]